MRINPCLCKKQRWHQEKGLKVKYRICVCVCVYVCMCLRMCVHTHGYIDIDLAFFLVFFIVKIHGNNRKTSAFKGKREKSYHFDKQEK